MKFYLAETYFSNSYFKSFGIPKAKFLSTKEELINKEVLIVFAGKNRGNEYVVVVTPIEFFVYAFNSLKTFKNESARIDVYSDKISFKYVDGEKEKELELYAPNTKILSELERILTGSNLKLKVIETPEISENDLFHFTGNSVERVKCDDCGEDFFKNELLALNGNNVCLRCLDKQLNQVKMTTTNNIDGYVVAKYIDIESVEVVLGTGIFSEFFSDIADFMGTRSTMFENKLNSAKKTAFKRLRYLAANVGGNAVIGIDVDYTEFSNNRIGVVVNGTIVKVEKNE